VIHVVDIVDITVSCILWSEINIESFQQRAFAIKILLRCNKFLCKIFTAENLLLIILTFHQLQRENLVMADCNQTHKLFDSQGLFYLKPILYLICKSIIEFLNSQAHNYSWKMTAFKVLWQRSFTVLFYLILKSLSTLEMCIHSDMGGERNLNNRFGVR